MDQRTSVVEAPTVDLSEVHPAFETVRDLRRIDYAPGVATGASIWPTVFITSLLSRYALMLATPALIVEWVLRLDLPPARWFEPWWLSLASIGGVWVACGALMGAARQRVVAALPRPFCARTGGPEEVCQGTANDNLRLSIFGLEPSFAAPGVLGLQPHERVSMRRCKLCFETFLEGPEPD